MLARRHTVAASLIKFNYFFKKNEKMSTYIQTCTVSEKRVLIIVKFKVVDPKGTNISLQLSWGFPHILVQMRIGASALGAGSPSTRSATK